MNVKKLTPNQKLKLVIAKNSWNNYDINGQIYKFKVADGPIGLRTPINPDNESEGIRPSVTYPSTQVLSQTWSTDLANKMGAAIANDCIENDVDIILGPGVNIKRVPVCGRNFEYYSEDPVVAGKLASEYIKGVQDRHVGTCIKHYCCNNQESARLFSSSDVDERTMREIYLKQFEIAFKAKPWTLMCSYNLVNGTLMANNKKMFEILRKDLHFDGLVMTDWCASRDSVATINSGVDIIMPYGANLAAMLNKGYSDGKVDEKMLDNAAKNVISLADKCEAESKLRKIDLTTMEREEIGLDIAREGMVLLKNDGVLPLSKKKDRIVITGANARFYPSGGGSANVTPRKPYIKLEKAMIDAGFDASYRETVRNIHGQIGELNGSAISVKDELTTYGRNVAIVGVGSNSSTETEGYDREHIKLSSAEIATIHYVRRFTDKVVVVVYAGSAIDMEEWIDEVSAVIYAGFCGVDANRVVTEILEGKTNPSGKLTETFPLKLEDVKAMNSYKDIETYSYTECLDVGYRYFETNDVPVLFPFGYGISYSDYKYSNLETKKCDDGIVASFDVKNTSKIDGKETAQLYISFETGEEGRPSIELKGFEKKLVKAGETEKYNITVEDDLLKYFSIKTNKWENIKGKVKIMIGKNVHDIELVSEIEL